MPNHSGSCLCGAVQFTVEGDLPRPDVCHCTQCRKQSGHCWASTDIAKSVLTVSGEGSLMWYQSSADVRRGFCARCGSFLFWERLHRDTIAIAMGAFDGATDTRVAMHIFVANKGDYYEIDDGVEQHE